MQAKFFQAGKMERESAGYAAICAAKVSVKVAGMIKEDDQCSLVRHLPAAAEGTGRLENIIFRLCIGELFLVKSGYRIGHSMSRVPVFLFLPVLKQKHHGDSMK